MASGRPHSLRSEVAGARSRRSITRMPLRPADSRVGVGGVWRSFAGPRPMEALIGWSCGGGAGGGATGTGGAGDDGSDALVTMTARSSLGGRGLTGGSTGGAARAAGAAGAPRLPISGKAPTATIVTSAVATTSNASNATRRATPERGRSGYGSAGTKKGATGGASAVSSPEEELALSALRGRARAGSRSATNAERSSRPFLGYAAHARSASIAEAAVA